MSVARNKDFIPAISLLQTLVADGVDDALYYEMRQLVPVFQPKLLRLSRPDLTRHALRAIIYFLENERTLECAIELGLHGELPVRAE